MTSQTEAWGKRKCQSYCFYWKFLSFVHCGFFCVDVDFLKNIALKYLSWPLSFLASPEILCTMHIAHSPCPHPRPAKMAEGGQNPTSCPNRIDAVAKCIYTGEPHLILLLSKKPACGPFHFLSCQRERAKEKKDVWNLKKKKTHPFLEKSTRCPKFSLLAEFGIWIC